MFVGKYFLYVKSVKIYIYLSAINIWSMAMDTIIVEKDNPCCLFCVFLKFIFFFLKSQSFGEE